MNALQTQLRVLSALTIREINSQQQNLIYGYVWTLIYVAITIGSLLVIKLAIHAFNPAGMPPATFIVTGVIPWYLFQHTYSLPDRAISRNRSLLAFPIVSEFDLILGAALEHLLTYGIMFVIGTTISSAPTNKPRMCCNLSLSW